MEKNLYICGDSAKVKHNLIWCGFLISALGEYRNSGLPIPDGFCTVRLEIDFAELGDRYALFSYPYYNFSYMAKSMKNCNGAQGASNATCDPTTAGISSVSSTIQLCAILRDLCTLRLRLDEFCQSENGNLFREMCDRYVSIDNDLCNATSLLSEFVGMYLTEEYLTKNSHE